MTKYDIILIGSGINSLVCAALLSKKGKKVLVLERSNTLGGCIQSEELEGCIIDSLSTAYPLFVTSPAYQLLKEDLENQGLEFVSNDKPTGTIMSNNEWAIIKTNREENIANFEKLSSGDGKSFDEQMNWVGSHAELLFTLLGQDLVNFKTFKFLGNYIWKNGIKTSLENAQSFLPSIRTDLPKHFKSKALIASLAPWVLHTGLSPESPFSSTMAKIVSMTVEMVGLPLVKGGSYKIVDAFKLIIEKNGGELYTHQSVEEILTANKKVTGVRTSNGTTYQAEVVVANVTPTQLYGKLLKNTKEVPVKTTKQAKNYKYGKGNMQIHLILNEKPKWIKKELENVTYVHLSDGIDDVSTAVVEANRQALPNKATICIAQPSAVDPSRAIEGKHIIWIQLPECPNYPIEDAGHTLSHLTKGEWTLELKEAYADRIMDRIEKYISNIKTSIIAKKIISPKELSELNINLVHGDPYSGQCELDQYLLWRPFSSVKNHETPIKNLYHIGASTHPGPGLGGGSGFLVAQKIK
jgi:phytoene dehydrogenase-like protein